MKRLSNTIDDEIKIKSIIRRVQKPYIGTLESNEFTMKKLIIFQKEFQPQISGKISKGEGVTIIKVKMEIESLTPVYCYTTIGIVVCIGYLLLELFSSEEILIPWYIPITILITSLSCSLLNYQQKVGSCKDDLEEVLEAEIAN